MVSPWLPIATGREMRRAVVAIQLPVAVELPGEEAGDAGQHEHGEGGERRAERRAEERRRPGPAMRADHLRHERQDQLGGDGDHREVLDRVHRRLDEQVDVEAQHVRDDEPHRAEHALEHRDDPRLVGAEAQPLVDAVDAALEQLHQPAEQLERVLDQAGQDAMGEVAARAHQPVADHLLGGCASAPAPVAPNEHGAGQDPSHHPVEQQPHQQRREAGHQHPPGQRTDHGDAAEHPRDREHHGAKDVAEPAHAGEREGAEPAAACSSRNTKAATPMKAGQVAISGSTRPSALAAGRPCAAGPRRRRTTPTIGSSTYRVSSRPSTVARQHRRHLLQEAQVDLAAAVDAVERGREQLVDAQQLIAAHQLESAAGRRA